MGLNRALVDTARRVYWARDWDGWDQGEPPADRQHGPWFRCRLQINQPAEGGGPITERARRLEGDAELMFGVRDSDGGFMADAEGNFTGFEGDDQLEVVSAQLGHAVWAINTGVEPIRARKRVLGYRVGLRLITEPTES